jgi:hypothetical protein
MIEPSPELMDRLANGAVLGTFGALDSSKERKAPTRTIQRPTKNLDRNNSA